MSLEGTLEVSAGVSTTEAEGEREPDSRSVEFAFAVENQGEKAVELSFTDAAKAEFVVYEDGQEHWRYTDGRLFAQLLSRDRIEPGGTTTYRATWERAEPGTYTAIATLRAQETDCQARSRFSVPG